MSPIPISEEEGEWKKEYFCDLRKTWLNIFDISLPYLNFKYIIKINLINKLTIYIFYHFPNRYNLVTKYNPNSKTNWPCLSRTQGRR